MKNVVTLPKGTKEYVVMLLGSYPDDFYPASALADISVTPVGADPDWQAAVWLPADRGYGLLLDTSTLAVGEYDLLLRVNAGVETPILGPDRLRVA